MALAQGLAALGRLPEALALMEDAIVQCDRSGGHVYMAELLRAKGSLLLSGAAPDDAGAEQCFRQALDWSRRQGALAWELRAATDYAAFLGTRGEAGAARAVLQPVVERFGDGAMNADLKAAGRLLADLDPAPAGQVGCV
jgi:predicted ATPase